MAGSNTLKFRTLRPDEVECRVATINDKGLSLLLYKDARVDQNVLDETVGIMNWKREHQLIGDRLYCTVSIWDAEKEQWIPKQDVGTESYSEKEKGQASDSFKRACFNLGIGRELYTAPFIWVKASDCKISEKAGKKVCYDKFRVTKMEVEDGSICALEIWNDSQNRMVYRTNTGPNRGTGSRDNGNASPTGSHPQGSTQQQRAADKQANTEMIERANKELIDAVKVKVVKDTIRQKGLSEASILSHYKLKNFGDMTMAHWTNAMQLLEKYPDKKEGQPCG